MFDGVGGVRVQRQGVAENIRGIFGLKEVTFLEEVYKSVVPTVEVRAIRYWEEFAEDIIRWNCTVVTAALAANFSGCTIALAGHPSGTIWTLDSLINRSGQTIGARTVVNPAGLAPVATANTIFGDSRWGGGATLAPISVTTGTIAAAPGVLFAQIQSGTWVAAQDLYIGRQTVDGGEDIVLIGETLNTAFSVQLQGRIILSR